MRIFKITKPIKQAFQNPPRQQMGFKPVLNNDKSGVAIASQTDLSLRKVATRPIRLDRQKAIESINRLKGYLQEGYYARHAEEPIGSDFTFIDKTTVKAVNGVEFEVQVNYLGKDSSGGNTMILGGGSGKTTKTKKPAIAVFINSKVTPKTFTLYALGERITNSVLETLEHELTHQADIFSTIPSAAKTQTLPSKDDIDKLAYFNNPSEVRAYMRSIFDDIEGYLPSVYKKFTVQQVMDGISGSSDTWEYISKYLTEDNRKLILKGVYQAVQDWYDAHQGAKEL